MTRITENEVLFKEIGLRKLLGFRSFHKSVLPLVRGFYVSRCLEALDICGCLDILRSEGKLNLADFLANPKAKNYDSSVLRSVCNYLYVVGLFSKKGDFYALTRVGRNTCLPRHGLFHFVQAYGPIFYELPDLLMGKKHYGSDIQRLDSFVAKATAEVSEWVPLPAIRSIIRKHQFENVLDLGCGRGELLLSIASEVKSPTLRGVDIAAPSVADGLDAIKKAGYSDRITLRVADITKPETLTAWLQDADVVTLMFVLHEFAKKGDDFVIDFLKGLKANSNSKTHFLIAETPLHDPDQIRKRPTAIAEHHLFHQLSNQGIIGTEQLRSIIKIAGFSIVEDLHLRVFSQHYVLAK
jgi:SAM-dependent methyltransferase